MRCSASPCHLPALLWIPAGGLAAGLVGGLVAPTALRLKGMYLAIVSIGLVYLGQYIFTNVSYHLRRSRRQIDARAGLRLAQIR